MDSDWGRGHVSCVHSQQRGLASTAMLLYRSVSVGRVLERRHVSCPQVFTIEPMINVGTWRDQTWPDGWTSTTADGKRSAQFEHTLVVTASGCDVLTARLPESPPLWWEAGAAKQPADGQPPQESAVTAQLQQQHLNGSAGMVQGSAAAAERTS